MSGYGPCKEGSRIQSRGVHSVARTGAASELVACVDLMRRGFHVFRSQSPACPCDLVVFQEGGPLIRVEVRTASIYAPTGNVTFPLKPIDEGRADVYALVLDNVVGYLPEGIVAPDFPFLVTENVHLRVAAAIRGSYEPA